MKSDNLTVSVAEANNIIFNAVTPLGRENISILGETRAGGSLAGKQVSPGTAVRIMTGAAIPQGADSVIKIVLTKGYRINSPGIGILASLNRDTVKVHKQPRVAIIPTGDELAGIGEAIEFDRIRDVNAYALSLLRKSGVVIVAFYFGPIFLLPGHRPVPGAA